MVFSMPRRFSTPMACSVANSDGQRSMPLRCPWVMLADTKPPLRPDAALRDPPTFQQDHVEFLAAAAWPGQRSTIPTAGADHDKVRRWSRRRAAVRSGGPGGSNQNGSWRAPAIACRARSLAVWANGTRPLAAQIPDLRTATITTPVR